MASLQQLEQYKKNILKSELVAHFSLLADKVVKDFWYSNEITNQIKNLPEDIEDNFSKKTLKQEIIEKLDIKGKKVDIN
jgi:hypothetical protein